MRDILKLIPKKKQSSVMQVVKQALENKSVVSTEQELLAMEDLDKASDTFERWYPSLYNYRSFSGYNQRRLRRTIVLKRLNIEFKRRVRKIGAFPSEQSLFRLVVSITKNTNEQLITGRRYTKKGAGLGLNKIFSKFQQFLYTILLFLIAGDLLF